MNQRHHVRTGSQGRKVLPPHAKPQKPAPMKRGTSYNNSTTTQAHTSNHSHHNSTSKAVTTKKAEESVQQDDDEEFGMASFLQFCATCEKQIVTPGSSILYCSEACRKRDVSRPPSLPSIHAISPSPMFSSVSYFDHSQPNIIPQRSPTVLRPTSLTLSDLSMSDYHSSADGGDLKERADRRESDAARYLDQFYGDFAAARPRANRNSTATDTSTTPSLVHSPSSSYGTVASNHSYRPLAPRHNPFTTTYHRKSLELVANDGAPPDPTQMLKDCSMKSSASTLTSYRVAEASDMSYESRRKSSSNKYDQTADNTLKQQLFNHDDIKASPKTR